MIRDYIKRPWNLEDVAAAGAFEVVDSKDYDFSWYQKSDLYDGGPLNSEYIDKVIISRHDFDIDNTHVTTPDDHRIIGYVVDGRQIVVTYSDGHSFEYCQVSSDMLINLMSILNAFKQNNVQHLFVDMLPFVCR